MRRHCGCGADVFCPVSRRWRVACVPKCVPSSGNSLNRYAV
ncbi:hypothetical protein NEILACOT_03614 [Neisseria lactamica ATCC 23970]|uniref:Uncharacterized protein n=1 Tax=Neisseria lactamica ATCC 23970 TaxID=546265 RepID=D0W7W4_NEILA|nr:hypothetical protein NEILACOT_03614 [Neisseria lactamica ATCC 23970]